MRTRFAPSPTGYLHIGGLRTALYSFLLARKEKGSFLLRIEDTDQERTIPGAIESIVRSLRWAGLNPDEGVMLQDDVIMQQGTKGPYIQSERKKEGMYNIYVQELVASGNAYPCFCTKVRLDEMRKAQEARKMAPMYDRTCLRLTKEEIAARLAKGEPHVIRMKVPQQRTVEFDDEIRGLVKFQGHTIDDQVLMKSDGFPTYHLAHVIDDHLMEIDLVVRGEEWLSSLPKHLLLFEFLGWKPPRYAHVPLLLNRDRTKLSKRQNAVAVEEYITKGYLPETLLNFIALLGWNAGTEQEIFSLNDLIEQFSLERVQKAGAVFDTEKLDWLQGQWMRHLPLGEFSARILPLVADKFPRAKKDSSFQEKAALVQERINFFHEAPSMLGFFYERPTPDIQILVNAKQKVTEDILPKSLSIDIATLKNIPVSEWTKERLLEAFRAATVESDLKLGQLLWPLRAALTGQPYSPGAIEVASAIAKDLGPEEVFARLDAALHIAQS